MSKRLQVLLDESEMGEIQKIARQQGITVAEWVRRVLRAARRGQSVADPDRKRTAVRKAAQHAFPSGDIDAMLEEIERGYKQSEDT